MSFTRGLVRHLSAALLGLTTLGAAQAHAQPSPGDGTSRFFVMVKGIRIGSESVDVTRTPTSLKISGVGQLAPPFDLVTSKFEMTYGSDGHPQQLTIEGVLRGQAITLATSFGVTTAVSDMMQGPQRGSNTLQISPRTIVLPSNFFAAYEALAARLGTTPIGTRLPVFLPPEGEIGLSVDAVTARRIVTPSGASDLKQFDLTFNAPGAFVKVQVWVDANGRLARIVRPSASLVVVREDLATVMAREETVRNAGDEDVFIGASGFTLAATITRPAGAAAKMPAVILVGGQGRQNRDETTYGVPKFGQMAGDLAAAGYLVVRYDKRGVGQSGGRIEHAGIPEYAEDVVAIVAWLRKRKDIDTNRIAVVAHGEGAAVALTAAAREKRITRVALVAAPGTSGRELTMEQQRLSLARLNEGDADRQAKIALQQRVIDAVITGNGWEAVPPDVRRQADSIWFKTWLLFDPRATIDRIKQPLLVVHGALDREIPVAHADRLDAMARARKGVPPAGSVKVIVPGVNHLLVPATTGEVDEYDSLPVKTVSPDVMAAIIQWLKG
jgi:pimeloyl-ACP methyl ester carboxylesterase